MRFRRHKNQEGQASVEFALTIGLLMAFVLFFFQVCMVFAWGNYVHYATFMSARALLSASPTEAEQQERARGVLARMVKRGEFNANVDRLPFIAKGEGDGDVKGLVFEIDKGRRKDRDLSWKEGVRYTFRSKVFLLPLGRQESGARDAASFTLTSESWLLRETSNEECAAYMGDLSAIFDNGC